ncbi:MAG: acyl carrier protein [Magnetococcales bacterium]|nr:acyl carrier protein [Magnetococcales bacterium]
MTKQEILNNLTEIFQAIFRNPDVQATEDMVADDVAEWDSVSHMSIIMEVEQMFNLRFDIGDIGRADKVSNLVEIIQAKGSLSE